MRLSTVPQEAISKPAKFPRYITLWLTDSYLQGKAASSKGMGSGKVTSVDGQVCFNAPPHASGLAFGVHVPCINAFAGTCRCMLVWV